MDAKRWERINEIFHRAMNVEKDVRAAYLDATCASDKELRADVERLLRSSAVEDSFLDESPLGRMPEDLLTPPEDDLAGKRVQHYEIQKLLGEGGMGVVYLARDLRLDRQVALKFLRKAAQADPVKVSRFIREAKAASSLDHPNICTIHGLEYDEEGRAFIVMTYYEGETILAKILNGSLTLSESVSYAMQAAQGLAKAHAAGIVHRDVKPANLLITTDEFLKILDFGIAKLIDAPNLTSTGDMIGTARYMAPELMASKTADYRSDIWSLGLVLSEMIESIPSAGGDVGHFGMNAPTATISRPRVTGARDEVERIAEKAMRSDPSDRYASMNELAEALKTIAFGSPSEQRKRVSVVQEVPSVAVLPLVNMSGSVESEYFSDGLTIELINTLSRIPGIRVVSRTTVFQFKGKMGDARELGQKLGVRALIEGSVRTAGDRIRVAVQLIGSQDGCSLWSERYDRTLDDLFAVEDELAHLIVNTLLARMRNEQKPSHPARTTNVEAHRLYLRGKHLLLDWTPAANLEAIGVLREALDLDPNYADAWAGLAEAELELGLWGNQPPRRAWDAVLEQTAKAIELNPNHAAAHAIRGSVLVLENWNWQEAEEEFCRAISLNPNDPDVRHMYASHLLVPKGLLEEAFQQIAAMEHVDPFSPQVHVMRGWAHLFDKNYAEAWNSARTAAELLTHGVDAYWVGCLASLGMGNTAEALSQVQHANRCIPSHSFTRALEVKSLVAAGRASAARDILQSLIEDSRLYEISSCHIGWAHIALGDFDAAFACFERALESREMMITYIAFAPLLNGFRNDSRFHELLTKTGLLKHHLPL